MQQIQLSPAKFTPDELAEQQQELTTKTELLTSTVAVDEVTVLFFNQEGEAEIVPHQEFCSIIQKPIPPIKNAQISAIERITYCFYCMLVEGKLQNLQSIEVCYERYMERTTFFSKYVTLHEKIRKWCKELQYRRDLTRAKVALIAILKQIREANQVRLEIMEWKVSVCLMLFDIIFGKLRVQRAEIIKLLKVFRTLKKENKISSRPAFNALRFIIQHLILVKSDLYIFFERELKLWCQEIVDNSLISEMKDLIQECEEITANSIKDFTNNRFQQATFRASNINKTARKMVTNTLNPHLFKESNPSALISRRFVRRRMSKEKEENFQKKVNHFLKIRENVQYKSLEPTPRNSAKSRLKVSIKMSEKPSVSLHSISRFTFDQAIVMKTALKSSKQQKKPQGSKEASAISLAASKSASCFSKAASHRRKNIYAKIIQKQGKSMAEMHKLMMEEMLCLREVELQKCNITLEEILIGQFNKVEDDPNIKFVGAAQDSQFGVLSLTFFTIFNQQLASISFLIREVSKRGYILKCKIRSTYCEQPTIFKINKFDKTDQFTLDELNESISKSVIYYQALQEKIERKIGVSQLQGMQEILRECKGYELSQDQLTKLLLSVDLLEGEFFWYYTKSNYINGCRIERRVSIDFTNLSAFAVSLGKFKSDYDSCLSEIILVQNIQSLEETCVYLSHGRKIVYKSLRKIKDVFYLEVITISDDVYKSFSRKDRKPFFKNTQVERVLLKVEEFNQSDSKQLYEESLDSRSLRVNLLECMKEEDIFIFFMKNIVENFIEIKYLRKIQKHLLKVNANENYEVFDEKLIVPYQKHSLDVVENNEQICDSKDFRPNVHSSIKHFRSMLIKYCEVYQLNPFLKIFKQSSHIIYIRKTAYIVHQTTFRNNLHLLKICKRSKEYNYSIFLYHQEPMPITLLITPFRSRFVMIDANHQVVGNLIRRSKAQMLLSEQCSNVTKVVLRYEKGYCYAVVSQYQIILSWKIDYYFPHRQAQYSTFLDQDIFFQCIGEWGENQEMWNKSIKQIKIDLEKECIYVHDKQVSLFKSIKKLYFYEEIIKGSLELILLQGQLSYLITNFQSGVLSLGKVQNTMFLNNKSIFSSISSSKESIEMYDNIMNHLYYKLINGKLPSQMIQTDYFVRGKQL